MTKKREWNLAALLVFLGVAGIGVCGAQGNVPGKCVDTPYSAPCSSPGGGGNHTYDPAAREAARAYSRYVASYNRALKLYKQAVPADATRGISLCQSALSFIDDALQNEPNDGNALTLRRQITACISSANGTLAVQRGNYDLGISYYRQAESEYPESNALWERNIAWAESVRRQGEAAQAYSRYIDSFHRAQNQYNSIIGQDTTRAISLCQSALSNIDEALRNLPGDGPALTMRRQITACISSCNGTLAVQQGDIDRGISLYRQAESEYPESNDIWEKDIAWAESKRLQANQPATPAATDGEELKDALNSGDSTGTGDATNSSPSHEAMDEANSTTVDTDHGLQSTTPEGKITGQNEDAGGGGNKIWDTTGEKSAVSPVDLRGVGRAPSVAKLLSHIPQNDKVKNDKLIQASVAWYGILENTKADTQQNIANIQQQIDNKQGNLYILKIEQTSYTNALKIIDQNQKKAEDVIKKELKNLSMEWIDAPAQQGPEAKPETASEEKQP